jgi:hypothetical protein
MRQVWHVSASGLAAVFCLGAAALGIVIVQRNANTAVSQPHFAWSHGMVGIIVASGLVMLLLLSLLRHCCCGESTVGLAMVRSCPGLLSLTAVDTHTMP